MLLEDAALQIGGLTYGRDKHRDIFNILKLHGSCNFFARANVGHVSMTDTPMAYLGPYDALPPKEARERLKHMGGFSPVMAVYRQGKPFIVQSHDLALLLQRWQQAVVSASIVFVIGASVNPDDTHIWETLSSREGKLYYFGLPGDEFAFRTWCAQNNCQNVWFVNAAFQDSVSVIRDILAGFSPAFETRISEIVPQQDLVVQQPIAAVE